MLRASFRLSLVLVALVACNRTSEGESDPPASKGTRGAKALGAKNSEGKTMQQYSFEALGHGFTTPTGGPELVTLVGDEEFFAELLSDHPIDPPPTIDWEQRAVIIVDLSDDGGQGYHAEVLGVAREGDLLQVRVKVVTDSWEQRSLDMVSRAWVGVTVEQAAISGQPRSELLVEQE